jgi:adenylosuccinate synthase
VDHAQEAARSAATAIGTTKRGIGPANVSKTNRIGVRVTDLRDMGVVEERIRANVAFFGLDEQDVATNLAWLAQYRELLLERCVDTSRLINDLVESGHSVLFEGAQGPLIDLEHGIYPYVTTSPTAIHSVGSGSGFDVSRVQNRIGVLKVYQTMVGNGAFVSEDHDELGTRMRVEGDEFGTTTGRSRRCGWLDLVQARWAVEVNGFTSIVVTKLDVLDSFDRVGVCVGYALDGELVLEFDAEHAVLEQCTPVFRYFDGWLTSTKDVETYEDLPLEARRLVDFIGRQVGVEIGAVTVGPRDEDMLVRSGTRLSTLVAS